MPSDTGTDERTAYRDGPQTQLGPDSVLPTGPAAVRPRVLAVVLEAYMRRVSTRKIDESVKNAQRAVGLPVDPEVQDRDV